MFDYLNPQLFHWDPNLQWLRINLEEDFKPDKVQQILDEINKMENNDVDPKLIEKKEDELHDYVDNNVDHSNVPQFINPKEAI